MNSKHALRRSPAVCLLIALALALRGRLRLRHQFVGRAVAMEGGQSFRVFRHLSRSTSQHGRPAVLIIRFRFKRFSQRVNCFLSLIPIPLIGGFPGFHDKLWMVDEETGGWQGVYEWESAESVEDYRASFVFGVMNRRADQETIFHEVIPGTRLADYINGRIGKRSPGFGH